MFSKPVLTRSIFSRIFTVFIVFMLILGDPFLVNKVFAQSAGSGSASYLGSAFSPVIPKPVIAPLPDVSGENAGYIAGAFDVTERGSASYKIPLTFPAGIGGMQPDFSLNYDSRGGNGLFGVGWSLGGLSTITRCPTTIVQEGFIDGVDFDDNDKLCLDGQRLVAVNGQYLAPDAEYRTENETFSKIKASTEEQAGEASFFTVWTKSGLIYEYGNTQDSKVEAQGKQKVLMWRVNKVTDTLGNTIEFDYFEYNPDGVSFPTWIRYTANPSQGITPYYKIQLAHENRPDPFSGYIAGTKSSITKRFKEINLYHEQELIRSYKLTYDLNPITSRSRLISVEECDASLNCLNPTTFTYTQGDTGFETAQQWLSSQSVDLFTFGNNHESFADFNGDGFADRIWMPNWNTSYWVSLSNGQSFSQPQQWQGSGAAGGFPTYSDYGRYEDYADLNGDGLTDRIWKPENNAAYWVALSTGTGFTTPQIWLPANSAGGYPSFSDNGQYEAYADLNGDGRDDRIWKPLNNAGYWVALSTGTGFETPTQWLAPNSAGGAASYSDLGLHDRYADLNGDGMADRIWKPYGEESIWVALSTGTGFTTPEQWLSSNSAGGYLPLSNYGQHETHVDLNGDGLADRVFMAYGQTAFWVALSTGTGFTTPQEWLSNNAAGGAVSYSDGGQFESYTDLNGDGKADRIWKPVGQSAYWVALSTGMSFGPAQQWIASGAAGGGSSQSANGISEGYVDANGDGLPDRVWIPNGSTKDMWVALKKAPVTDHLISIENGHGRQINIEYTPLTDNSIYTKRNDAVYPAMDVQAPMYVVSAHEVSNGLGGFSRYSYIYTGLKIEQNGHGFCGFESIKKIDEQDGTFSVTNYWQDFPFKSIPSRISTHQPNGDLINSVDYVRDVKYFDNNTRYFPYIQKSTEIDLELDGTFTKSIVIKNDYDDYGNLIWQETKHSDGQIETLNNAYDNDLTLWHLGRLRDSSVTREATGELAITRTSHFDYDPTTGLLTDEIIEPGDPQLELHTSYQYDAFGNIRFNTKSGPTITARTEETQYDPSGRFVTNIFNGLDHEVIKTYDPLMGHLKTLTDINGLKTTYTYDSFDRLVRVKYPNGTESRTLYFLAEAGAPVNAVFYKREDASGQAPVITYYDALDREIRKETVGFGGEKIFVDKEYNLKGQLYRESAPYFEGDTPQWTQYDYDLKGRVTTITQPGNRITTSQYAGFITTTTNPLNQTVEKEVNATDDLIRVKDHYGNEAFYFYDSYRQLREVQDPAGNLTTIEHDIRGNKTRIVDPDSGQTDFVYNELGLLKSKTDAKGQTVTYDYDLLNRMTGRIENEGITTWQFDTAPYGVGQLDSVVGPDGYTKDYFYDGFARVRRVDTTADSKLFRENMTYDAYGRLQTLHYPSGYAVAHLYNDLGFLDEIREYGNGQLIWKQTEQNASGQLTEEKFGNGLNTRYTFNPMTDVLEHIETGVGLNNDIQNLRFMFDDIGNLKTRWDDNNGLQENFDYDDLNRLTDTQVVNGYNTHLDYDALGNIFYKSDVGTYTYGENGAGPHAVTSIAGSVPNTYTYDANGNRLTSLDSTVDYTSFNKPTLITRGNVSLEFKYAPDYKRYKQVKTISGRSGFQLAKYYVEGNYEREETGANFKHKHYIFAGQKMVAIHNQQDNGTQDIQYLHKDHLGSTQTITDGNGQVLETLSYDAWGRRRSADWVEPLTQITSSVDRGFTGHEHLDDVGLIHMNGRVYDPIVGRFLSADPHVQAPENIQSLNRYSYVLNNPLSYTDPSGYFLKGLFKFLLKPLKPVLQNKTLSTIFMIAMLMLPGGQYWAAGFQAANSYANGGSFFDGVKIAGISLAQSYAFDQVGGHFKELAPGGVEFASSLHVQKVIAHGAVGGSFSVLQGGKFQHGFISASATQFFAPGITESLPGKDLKPARVAIAAAVGGTAAKIGGGSFANGAITGAFSRLFNDEMHKKAMEEFKKANPGVSMWPESANKTFRDVTSSHLAGDCLCDNNNDFGSVKEFLGELSFEVARDKLYKMLNIDFVQSSYANDQVRYQQFRANENNFSGGSKVFLGPKPMFSYPFYD